MGAPRFVSTTRQGRDQARRQSSRDAVLVLAHHPALARVGQFFALRDRIVEVSRLKPSWVARDGSDAGPLDDPFVSRKPIVVRRLAGAIEIECACSDVAVDGTELPQGAIRRLSEKDVHRGIDIVIGKRVALWLTTDHDPSDGDDLGLYGCSSAMSALRADIRAAGSGPVLVRGETGAGKELVARALHATGPRAAKPFVVVNVAAIPTSVAASELFGHERGAFTGAGEKRAGYFERADGGVLFLDEIGHLPEALQSMLLRALESGEIQPIGGQPRKVDVVVVTATDADLQAAERFSAPLYYRLAATHIDVPPLRERRVDIPLLLSRFLDLPAELQDQTTEADPWLRADLVAALMRAEWPGNVRQLRSVAQRLVAMARAGRRPDVEEMVENAKEEATAIDDDRLVLALRAHRFQLNRTAEALGISRTHLDALIARSPRVRKAKDLERDEILACGAALGNDIDAMAAKLEVSPRGLRLRMRQLGL